MQFSRNAFFAFDTNNEIAKITLKNVTGTLKNKINGCNCDETY